MWVGELIVILIMRGMTWKSTSSCGGEYFDCVRGLGFESYECPFVLLFVVIFKM